MIQSLDRGIKILEFLASRSAAGVTEIASELDIHKSSAYRLIETLEFSHLVEQDALTSKYRLSVGVLQFAGAYKRHLNITGIGKPFMEKLVLQTQESAHLAVLSNNRVVVIDQVKSIEVIKVSATIGVEEGFYCSAVGKAILANLSEERQQEIIQKIDFIPLTKNTIVSESVLMDQLDQIKKQGFAVDDEEVTPGVRCIAAPIRDINGEANYCIGISGLALRINYNNIDKYATTVKKIAGDISVKMGFGSRKF